MLDGNIEMVGMVDVRGIMLVGVRQDEVAACGLESDQEMKWIGDLWSQHRTHR